MTILRSMILLLLIALCCIPAVSATGNGTFSLSSSTGVDTGENLTVTVYLENTWSPRASDVYLHLLFNSSVLDYVGTDYRIGHTVAATLDTPDSVFLQFGDFSNGYPNGKYPIADLHFRAVRPGTSRLTVVVDHVRYYVPVDIGDSATSTADTITIGSGPSDTGEAAAPATTRPAQTVTAGSEIGEAGIPGGTATTVVPGVTVQGSVVPSVPATTTSTVTVSTFSVVQTIPVTPTPSAEYYAGSDDYTGVVTEQPLITTAATTAATPSPSPPPTPTVVSAAMTAGQVPSTTTTVQTSVPITTVQGTTTAATIPPQNATTTPMAGTDSGLLALLSLGGIALLSIARRRY